MLAHVAVMFFAAGGTSVQSVKLSAELLKTANPHGDSSKVKRMGIGNSARRSGVPGVDSVVNFVDSFTTPGFDSNGNPQSVWQYEMVGRSPDHGGVTVFNAPVIAVVLDLLAPDGTIAFTFDGSKRTHDVVASPIFQPFSNPGGFTQFTDGMMRTQFWNRIHHGGDDDNGYHNILIPNPRHPRHMRVPFFTATGGNAWFVFVDAAGNPLLAAVDETVFGNLLFPTTVPVDGTTLIGASELAGDMTTRDITSFLFDNLALFDGDINNCCVLGFHTYDFEPGDSHNGNRERRFVFDFMSWLSPGLFFFGFEDITPGSHELSELFADPFVDNATPWWENVDPFAGFSICQNNLETGDVIEILTSIPVFQVFMNGRTYHPQNEALLPWFAFESPSSAKNGAYSYPDETTQTSLSPGPLLPGCVPAP